MDRTLDKFRDSNNKYISKLVKNIKLTQESKKLDEKQKAANIREMANGLSLVHIYFKDVGVMKYTRDESYGVMDLIGISF